MVTFSSDLVFDGKKDSAYTEDDQTRAINVYGHSKQLAEEFCRNVNPASLIIRTSAFFGPWDKHNFVYHTLNQLASGREVIVPNDIIVSPTYVPHLVQATLDLLIDDEAGIWHLANKAQITWHEFAKQVALKAGFDPGMVKACTNLQSAAPRPRNSSLKSKKYSLMPALETAIEQYLIHRDAITKKGYVSK